LNGESCTCPHSTTSGWCSSIHVRRSASPQYPRPVQDVGDPVGGQWYVPPGAHGDEHLAELEGVAVDHAELAQLVHPERGLLAVATASGQVVVPRRDDERHLRAQPAETTDDGGELGVDGHGGRDVQVVAGGSARGSVEVGVEGSAERTVGTIRPMAGPIATRLLPDTATATERGHLAVGGLDLLELAAEFGTPLFVYDESHLRSRAREAVAMFGAGGVVYATKAFLCVAMARLADEEGLLLDVATGGELHVALAAGVAPERLVLHGNNKSVDELRAAITAGVGRIVVDSFDELDRLEGLHREGLPVPRVQLRITPGIHAHTHEYVQTGQEDSKFGFGLASGAAAAAVERARASPAVELVGLHAHIGSNVFAVGSFAKAASVMAGIARPLGLPELTLGGGLGVAYVEDERAPTITAWGEVVKAAVADAGVEAKVLVEPGRAIVASAAVTLYTVGTVKDLPGIRTYVAVDGGMSDNPRPVLYGSGYEAFLPRAPHADRPKPVRIVGKHCESGDVLVHEAFVPEDLVVGDILATPVTGAYGHAMGSNYNKVPRPAVVFVADGTARLVVRRETYDDLLRTDVG
jgi:diaminopimelate decarboxylase